ncbi:hypothetical protein HDU79_000509 [Rhizoclosmatium sp. JEL0117]|nr:hypothetical protein HDU79_000509 [Rhizoclosmatium sp. JEL0117]
MIASQQFIRNVQKEEMRIVASAHIATIITNEQIEYAATVMKRVSARYIVIFGDSGFVAEAMYKLGKLGFKGSSGIVWFAQNAPNPFYDPLKDSSTRDDVLLNTNFQAAYDCTMNMLYGINKLLEANKGLEPLLSLREAGPLMNYTLFQKTEYKGILNETFELTSDGSLKV